MCDPVCDPGHASAHGQREGEPPNLFVYPLRQGVEQGVNESQDVHMCYIITSGH